MRFAVVFRVIAVVMRVGYFVVVVIRFVCVSDVAAVFVVIVDVCYLFVVYGVDCGVGAGCDVAIFVVYFT